VVYGGMLKVGFVKSGAAQASSILPIVAAELAAYFTRRRQAKPT